LILGLATAIIGIVQGVFVDRPTAIELGVVVPESALIAAAAYFVVLRPAFAMNKSGIVVRNATRTIGITWSTFESVSTEPAGLVVHYAGRRQVVAAVPAGGRKVHGVPRTEIVAQAVSQFASTELRVGDADAFKSSTPLLSREERLRQQIAISVGLILGAGWCALVVLFIVGGH
jgi:hypothetical protein